MSETYKIAFDGLHRCGKGTQISLIGSILADKNIPYEVVRGDGTRKGLGLSREDPHSMWWQENYSRFFDSNRTPEENKHLSDLVYSKLTEEAHERLRDLSLIGSEESALLIDRSFVSRWFVKRQQDPYIDLESSLHIVNPLTGKPLNLLLPDSLYVLNVTRDELLRRVETSTDSPEKKEFRKRNILDYYDLFAEVIHDLPENYLGSKIHVIDGERNPIEISSEILRREKIGT